MSISTNKTSNKNYLQKVLSKIHSYQKTLLINEKNSIITLCKLLKKHIGYQNSRQNANIPIRTIKTTNANKKRAQKTKKG